MSLQLSNQLDSDAPLEQPHGEEEQVTHATFPPSYAAALPSPDYSQALLPCEEVVESSFHPPPYPLTRVGSNAPSVASSSSRARTSWLSDWLYESSLTSRDSISEETGSEQAETASIAPTSIHPSTASSSSTNARNSLVSTIPPIPETQEHYQYHSGSIELDLGPRPDPDERTTVTSTFPTYGHCGTVKGFVNLRKVSHVQSVIVAIEGRAQTTIMQAGLASGHTALKILDMSKVVYTATTSDASKGKGKSKEAPVSSFPFEFELPSTADNSTDPLPPTFRGVHPVMEGIIKYIIKVTVVKFGLWPRETFSTVIHYLPKYYLRDEALLWPAISLMDAKRFGLECNNKWRTSNAHLLYDPEESSRLQNPGTSTSKNAPLPELSVSIPSTAQAVANYCFPVNVTLRLPNHTEEYIEELLTDSTRFSIAMMKSITMTVNGQKSSQIINLARANKQQVERELVSSTTERIVRGWFRAGTNEGEASWKIGDLVETKYFIRVTVHLEPKQPPIFKHDEPIQMFTHSKEQFASPFEIQDAPAPNLLLASSLGNTRQRF